MKFNKCIYGVFGGTNKRKTSNASIKLKYVENLTISVSKDNFSGIIQSGKLEIRFSYLLNLKNLLQINANFVLFNNHLIVFFLMLNICYGKTHLEVK